MLKDLTKLGLTDDEAKVYLALLELGGAFVSQIAKKSGKNRSTCYHTLNNLITKGLASKFEKGKYLFFSPESAEKIVTHAQNQLQMAHELLPELLSIQNTLAHKPKIKFFEGVSGIETIFEDTLTAKGEILGYTNLYALIQLFPDFFRKYTKERIAKGIKTRYLSPQPPGTSVSVDAVLEFFPKNIDPHLVEILFVNPAEFPFKNEVAIYGNKVAIMSLSEDEIIAILIENPTVAQTFKAIFDLSWLGATSFIAR